MKRFACILFSVVGLVALVASITQACPVAVSNFSTFSYGAVGVPVVPFGSPVVLTPTYAQANVQVAEVNTCGVHGCSGVGVSVAPLNYQVQTATVPVYAQTIVPSGVFVQNVHHGHRPVQVNAFGNRVRNNRHNNADVVVVNVQGQNHHNGAVVVNAQGNRGGRSGILGLGNRGADVKVKVKTRR